MIGPNALTLALLLPPLVLTTPVALVRPVTMDGNANHGNIQGSGKLAMIAAKYCGPEVSVDLYDRDKICHRLGSVAKALHVMESVLFCESDECTANYNPLSQMCECVMHTPEQIREEDKWPEKYCNTTLHCYAPFEPHWNPNINKCSCALDTFHRDGSVEAFKPNGRKDELYRSKIQSEETNSIYMKPTNAKSRLKDFAESIQELEKQYLRYQIAVKQLRTATKASTLFQQRRLEFVQNWHIKLAELRSRTAELKQRAADAGRSPASDAVSLVPLPTYIPPPNTQVTQELLQESLSLQPQQLAVVGSAIPHFADGVISFHVQLDGPISQTLVLNATDTLPCENIGSEPQPSLIVVPKTVKNGTAETVLATCLIIAVNIYDPKYITYWVQTENGAVFTLLSDTKVHAIDQLDTSQPANIEIRVATPVQNSKRDLQYATNIAPLQRRQLFSIACNSSCPFPHMERIHGSDGYCGCVFKSANQKVELTARGVEEPTRYTATMTAEACAAMTCINNGGQPALFNPFTATCWCSSPKFVEVNDNAYGGGL